MWAGEKKNAQQTQIENVNDNNNNIARARRW